MRTITLFASEFNINNKLLGKRIMEQAEKHKILEPEQFGSRKHHRSIMVALNQRLKFDLCRQRRQALATVSVDAKFCYDRIVHNVACINLRRLGIPIEPLLCMFKTLQVAHHHIMTAFGISETTYRSLLEIPLQGIGQGNGAGPSIWAVINAPIIRMVKDQGGGAIFRTAIALTCLTYAGFSFVDDSDIIETDENVNTPGEQLISSIQSSLDIHNGGLYSSGGALKRSKCVWRLIDWTETPYGWTLRDKEDMPGHLTIVDYDSNTRVVIDRIEAEESREILGVMISPDGTWKDQKSAISNIVNEFSTKLKSANLSKGDVKCAIDCMLWKKLNTCYPRWA